tara:strand:+ start:1 stop:1548 length:1548 start_codon:yes stop_codon:yes gene_type:complete
MNSADNVKESANSAGIVIAPLYRDDLFGNSFIESTRSYNSYIGVYLNSTTYDPSVPMTDDTADSIIRRLESSLDATIIGDLPLYILCAALDEISLLLSAAARSGNSLLLESRWIGSGFNVHSGIEENRIALDFGRKVQLTSVGFYGTAVAENDKLRNKLLEGIATSTNRYADPWSLVTYDALKLIVDTIHWQEQLSTPSIVGRLLEEASRQHGVTGYLALSSTTKGRVAGEIYSVRLADENKRMLSDAEYNLWDYDSFVDVYTDRFGTSLHASSSERAYLSITEENFPECIGTQEVALAYRSTSYESRVITVTKSQITALPGRTLLVPLLDDVLLAHSCRTSNVTTQTSGVICPAHRGAGVMQCSIVVIPDVVTKNLARTTWFQLLASLSLTYMEVNANPLNAAKIFKDRLSYLQCYGWHCGLETQCQGQSKSRPLCNNIDACCYHHDRCYDDNTDTSQRKGCDDNFFNCLDKIDEPAPYSKDFTCGSPYKNDSEGLDNAYYYMAWALAPNMRYF